MSEADDLNQTFVNVLGGEACSESDLIRAEKLANSPVLEESIRANGVLLAGGGEPQKLLAQQRLQRLVTRSQVLTAEAEFTLLVVLMQLRTRIVFSEALVEFVFRAASSPRTEIRTNAAIVLGNLAMTNNEAHDLLRRLMHDPDPSVGHNAETALRQLNRES